MTKNQDPNQWEEEFAKEFNGRNVSTASPRVKDFIRNLLTQERNAIIEAVEDLKHPSVCDDGSGICNAEKAIITDIQEVIKSRNDG